MQQNLDEFAWMLEIIKGAKSILEVGSFDGASLRGMAAVAAPGARLRSIDDGRHNTAPQLTAEIASLNHDGFDANLFIGDSHNEKAREWAAQWAPYDFVFIDGDHDMPGVEQDWFWYGPMGKLVGFHDIIAHWHDVHNLWKKIKLTRPVRENTMSGSTGIGLVQGYES